MLRVSSFKARIVQLALILLLFHVLSASVAISDPNAKTQFSEEYQIGVMVKAIDVAIQKPQEASSLETIVHYGTDSRYYVMIRGWLSQELAGVDSQINAGAKLSDQGLQTKAEFLRKAIRRIDLE